MAVSRRKLAPTEAQLRYDTPFGPRKSCSMGIRACIIYPSQPPFGFSYAVELGFVSFFLPSEFGVNAWRGGY